MSASERRLLALLNKIRAIIACGAGTINDLTQYVLESDTGSSRNHVKQWMKRERLPNGENTLAITEWVRAREREIEASGAEAVAEYASAKNNPSASMHPPISINDEGIALIKSAPAVYGMGKALAKKFGVSESIISRIRIGKRRTYVEPTEKSKRAARAFIVSLANEATGRKK